MAQTLAMMADGASRRRAASIWWDHLLGRSGDPAGERTVELRLAAFGGLPVHMRPSPSDLYVLWTTLHLGWSAPPRELAGTPLRRIVVLGLNTGLDLACLAAAYPEAELLGVEADAVNASIARRNAAPFGPRCQVVHAAVWDRAAAVAVERAGASYAHSVREAARPGTGEAVAGRTLDELLAARWPDEGPVDFAYIDIEGTHARLLDAGERFSRINALKIAGHERTRYSEAECASGLEGLGYRTRVIPCEPIGWTVGVRET